MASVCFVGVIALFAASAPALADDDPSETVELEASDDAVTTSIADAHAQFSTVAPTNLSLDFTDNLYGRVLAYAGVDAWRYGGSAYVGGEVSLDHDDVFIVRGFASDGLDDFRTASTTYRSETARASFMPGVHFKSGPIDVKIVAGFDYMIRLPLKPFADMPVQFFGGRASIDLWWEPNENWMLSGSASATTIESGVSGRVAAGWKLPLGWVGPEALVTHDIYNTQYRAGAHLTGFKVGMTEWSIAGGYGYDSFNRSGPYGRIGVTLRP